MKTKAVCWIGSGERLNRNVEELVTYKNGLKQRRSKMKRTQGVSLTMPVGNSKTPTTVSGDGYTDFQIGAIQKIQQRPGFQFFCGLFNKTTKGPIAIAHYENGELWLTRLGQVRILRVIKPN